MPKKKAISKRNAPLAPPISRDLGSSGLPIQEPGPTHPSPSADQVLNEAGSRVRTLRNRKGWSLTEAARELGIGRSTLAKLEVGQMSPTLGLLHKIATGLHVDLGDLIAEAPRSRPSGRRAFTRTNAGERHDLDGYHHEMLCAGLEPKQMIPFFTTIKPREGKDIPPWFRHAGEEFVLVMKGSVIFYSEYYAPTTLSVGDSIYLDAQMGHCFVTQDNHEAVVLFVTTHQGS